MAACTRAQTPLADTREVVSLSTVHNRPTHRDLLLERDSPLPTMVTMRRWRQKITCQVYPSLPCIFCGAPMEDATHMHVACEREPDAEESMWARVEEFTADVLLTDRTMK